MRRWAEFIDIKKFSSNDIGGFVIYFYSQKYGGRLQSLAHFDSSRPGTLVSSFVGNAEQNGSIQCYRASYLTIGAIYCPLAYQACCISEFRSP